MITMAPVSNSWIMGWEWKNTHSNHSSIIISGSTSPMSLCHSHFSLPIGSMRIKPIVCPIGGEETNILSLKDSLQKNGEKDCKSQRQWMNARKLCLLHTTGQVHLRARSSCKNIHMTCTSLRTILRMEMGGGHKAPPLPTSRGSPGNWWLLGEEVSFL